VDASSATALAALNALIAAPDTAYVNLHSTQFSGGVVRSQMFPVVNTVAQAAGGGDWLTAVTVSNPSPVAAVQGLIDFYNADGSPMPAAVTDPNISFRIPAGGSATFSTHNKGSFAGGFARVFSNATVSVESRYNHSLFAPNTNSAETVTSRAVSLPVAVGTTANANTGVALIANAAGTLTLTLTSTQGIPIVLGSRTIDVTAGQQISAFVSELMSSVTATQYTGRLTISIGSGTISVLALQFDSSITPVSVSALP
jgi:hypothetical protein